MAIHPKSKKKVNPKTRYLIITAVILPLCILSILFVRKALSPESNIEFDQTNKAVLVMGDAKIMKANEEGAWKKLDASTTIEKGDVIETGAGSRADILFGRSGDKALKIEEKSRLEFEGINPSRINLSGGRILVDLKMLEKKSSFVVKTPTSICGVRGTGWSETAGPKETDISVFESAVFVHELNAAGKPRMKRHTVSEGTRRILPKDKPISKTMKIAEADLEDWNYWKKNVIFLRQDRILVSDFDRNENINNLGGTFGCWNVFYSDDNQGCRDELTNLERVGDTGYGLKLTYDVDTPFSAYNGFFTKLMDIDVSDYKYLVFFIKGDNKAGFTERINIELKNNARAGKATVEGITDRWQKIVVPLKSFSGINDFKDMKEFVIVFSDINVTRKEGVIYIDNIYFSKDETEKDK